jgi:serine/threonine-protein kinase
VSERALPRPGDVVAGKYVIKDVIGRGGVGVVIAADHKALRCPVALKFLRPEVSCEPPIVQRFLREAHAAARLRSEHVARVMDAGSTDDGAAYLVMELLVGRDFATLLKEEGPLPPSRAVDYLLQACDAVAEAHSVGIVHRDLKAANLFLTRRADGRPLVKVLDFGLSKIERTPSQATITTEHHVIGSPHYMSPEQMRSSREVDARSDIWSLGVVLYTLLAGRKPFEGTYLTEVCAAVLSSKPPALSALRPELPPALVEAVERCLQVEPEDRFQTVAELIAALAPFRASSDEPAHAAAPTSTSTPMPLLAQAGAAPRRARDRSTALIATAAVAALGVVVVLAVRRTGASDAAATAAPAQPAIASTASRVEPAPAASSAIAAAPAAPAAPANAVAATAAPRRASGSGGRRASAPATPTAAPASTTPPTTAPPSRPAASKKSDEDVIMGLPH